MGENIWAERNRDTGPWYRGLMQMETPIQQVIFIGISDYGPWTRA